MRGDGLTFDELGFHFFYAGLDAAQHEEALEDFSEMLCLLSKPFDLKIAELFVFPSILARWL